MASQRVHLRTAGSLEAEIISAKTDGLNIIVPGKEGEEYKEHGIPEQFLSKYDQKTGKFNTGIVAHSG